MPEYAGKGSLSDLKERLTTLEAASQGNTLAITAIVLDLVANFGSVSTRRTLNAFDNDVDGNVI